MKKLAIILTHPIQYYSPVFQLLAKHIAIKVFYTMGDPINKYDIGFQQKVEWDIPLLQGYDFEFLSNKSAQPGTHRFLGIDNVQAIERIHEFRPTAILVYGWAYKSHLKIIRYFHGKVKILFRGDSTALYRHPIYKAVFKKILLKWVYRHVDAAFYVGSQNRTYFLKYGLKGQQLVFAPHAVDNGRFSSDRSSEATALRQSFGIRKNEILVLFTGKFKHIKDPLILLRAFLDIEPTDTHLLFVGGGHLEQRLKNNASGHKSIHFLPFQNQQFMPVVYQSCDLFCMPSNAPGESWGMAINEAMAAGKAILSSSMVGAAADLVRIDNGRIFKCGNYNDLKTALKKLIGDKQKLKTLGERSSAIIADWTFEKQIQGILAYV
jgi:glycosyltransferase involved in cell wall biosynthesis